MDPSVAPGSSDSESPRPGQGSTGLVGGSTLETATKDSAVQDPFAEADEAESLAHDAHIRSLFELAQKEEARQNEEKPADMTPEEEQLSLQLLSQLTPEDLEFTGALSDRLTMDFFMQRFLEFDVEKVRDFLNRTRLSDLEGLYSIAEKRDYKVPDTFWTFVFFAVRHSERQSIDMWARFLNSVLRTGSSINRVVFMHLLEVFSSAGDLKHFLLVWNNFLGLIGTVPPPSVFAMGSVFLQGLQYIGTSEQLPMVYTVLRFLEAHAFGESRFISAPFPRARMSNIVDFLREVREPEGHPLPAVGGSTLDSPSFLYAFRCFLRCGSSEHAGSYFIRAATHYPDRISRRMLSSFLQHAVKENVEQVGELFDLLRRHWPTQSATPHMYSIVMNCFSRNTPAILSLYNQMLELDVPRTEYIYVQIMKSLNYHRRYADVMKWYDKMQEDLEGAEENSFARLQYLKAAAYTTSFSTAVDSVLEDLKQSHETGSVVNMHILNAVVSGLARQRRFPHVRRIWHRMVTLGFAPSNHVINTFVYAFAQANDFEAALELLDTVEQKWGIKPKGVHLATLLQHTSQAGRRDDLPKILHAMQKAKIPPNETTALTLIRSMALQNDFAGINDVINSLTDSGMESPRFMNRTLQVLVDVVTRREGHTKPVLDLVQMMQDSGIPLTIASKHRVLRLFIFVEDTRKASRALEDLLSTDASVETLAEIFPKQPSYTAPVPAQLNYTPDPTRNRDGTLLSIALYCVCRYPNPFIMPIFRHLMSMYPDYIPTVGDFMYPIRALMGMEHLAHVNEIIGYMERRKCPFTFYARTTIVRLLESLDPVSGRATEKTILDTLSECRKAAYPSDPRVLREGTRTIHGPITGARSRERAKNMNRIAEIISEKFPLPPPSDTPDPTPVLKMMNGPFTDSSS